LGKTFGYDSLKISTLLFQNVSPLNVRPKLLNLSEAHSFQPGRERARGVTKFRAEAIFEPPEPLLDLRRLGRGQE